MAIDVTPSPLPLFVSQLCTFVRRYVRLPSVFIASYSAEISYIYEYEYSNSFTPSYSIRNGPIKYLFDNKVPWLATTYCLSSTRLIWRAPSANSAVRTYTQSLYVLLVKWMESVGVSGFLFFLRVCCCPMLENAT